MRSDMAKVIVERPRVGGGWLRKGRPLRDEDDPWPKFRRDDLHDRTKRLNENLAPLRRYLERQVGRRWDDVWSEVCANLKPTSTVQQHVRDHIPDYVAMKTSLRDGEIWIQERWGPVRLKGTSYVRLYVDPRDGILRRNMAWQKRRVGYGEQRAREDAERALRMRLVDRTTQLHRFGDCWWEVTLVDGHPRGVRLVPLGECGWTRIVEEDVVQRAGLSTLPLRELYGRANCYAVAKRQLSRKEMRDLGLARPH